MKYIKYFIKIKELTETHWNDLELNKKVYGFQIQKGTTWKKGLSKDQIREFENSVGFQLPEILRDYYTVMNGVNKKQINIYGSLGCEPLYSQNIYSFPDDIQAIKDVREWIYKANKM
ncbi:MAG: SMI1/KNR4 family protein [Coriobacteriales bacterium]|nr:SMI1/KNR4 family protein [Coriobacteriales bacterium]